MKQCNYCAADCRPSKAMAMSDLDCSKFKPINRRWKLRHVISKITVSDEGAMSDTLQYLLKWAT